MASTIHVPLLGNMPKGAVLAGGVAVVGVGGYLLYKHYTKTSGVPAATGYGYGYGYGTSAYGYGAGSYGYGYSPFGTGGFGGGIPFPFGSFQGYGYGQGPQPITTNAQWGAAAEAAMGSSGNDAIAAAIAKYLAGATVNQAQELTIQEAIAVVGPPPVEGIAGYPPKIHVSKGKGNGGSIAVPNVVGSETARAVRIIESKGLTASHPRLQPGHGSVVTAEHPSAGTKVKSGSNVALSIREKK